MIHRPKISFSRSCASEFVMRFAFVFERFEMIAHFAHFRTGKSGATDGQLLAIS
jgi:hypothetical protein